MLTALLLVYLLMVYYKFYKCSQNMNGETRYETLSFLLLLLRYLR